ncbi:hypothetical protein EYF80_013639 [Liparis tanakae]|uniref:Uncharacterized protein n=1 Tax=Liparis tanakae TaxID=230148 RepID=A0A4Z2IDM9_9TELE|nr:hypothetical protein EYF80_013639 [Liparis tanakae]
MTSTVEVAGPGQPAADRSLRGRLEVLGLEDRRQLAGGNLSGHLGGAVRLPTLAGHMERCVPLMVLQLQTGPFLHQALHHVGQVQAESRRSSPPENLSLGPLKSALGSRGSSDFSMERYESMPESVRLSSNK